MRSQRRLVSPLSAVNLSPNTFIGGVASAIPNKASLAAKLAIAESSIYYLGIVGNDIEAGINVNYAIPNFCFYNDVAITKFLDKEGKANSIGEFAFSMQSIPTSSKLKEVVLPGATIAERHAFSYNKALQKVELDVLTTLNKDRHFILLSGCKIYIPQCTTIGNSNSIFDAVFSGSIGSVLYCDPAFATINSGSEEPDIAYFRSNGNAINYITNFTAPNAVNNLSIGTKYATALQINFTPPSSLNAIDFYECYVNGVYKNNISASGVYITGLNPDTPYIITIKAVDIYYNKSEFSNSVSDATSATYVIPTGNIASYYKLEGNALDSIGTKNGTVTGVTYSNGYAIFNGSSYIVLPADLIANLTNFSYSFLALVDDNAAEYRIFVLNNNTGMPYTRLALNSGGVANRIQVNMYSGTVEPFINTTSYDVKNLIHIGVRASLVTNLMSLFVNGNPIGSAAITSLGQIGSGNNNVLGANRNAATSSNKMKGKMRGVSIWNTALTDAEHYEIASKQLSGQQLI